MERNDPGGGGLTGATGDLTPDGSDEPFVPAERREQIGAEGEGQGSVTFRQGASASAQLGDVGEPGTEPMPGEQLNRESGYGSQHGLSPEDPAYRMDVSPPADAVGDADGGSRRRTRGEPRQGVDDVTDQEERF